MIYDISPLISTDIDVWPGDTAFTHHVDLSTDKGDHLTLSSIKTTVHLGAHTDAPNHYATKADGISDAVLNRYIGKCQVVDVHVDLGDRIQLENINIEIEAQRILFKTNTFKNPNQWNEDFAALSAELIEFLAGKDVLLVGIDTPSIDLFDDKQLEAHTAVFKNNMSILEGIVLADIEPGFYELIALPLKIKGADASPVRAILRDLP